jgi:hypothetical protein
LALMERNLRRFLRPRFLILRGSFQRPCTCPPPSQKPACPFPTQNLRLAEAERQRNAVRRAEE